MFPLPMWATLSSLLRFKKTTFYVGKMFTFKHPKQKLNDWPFVARRSAEQTFVKCHKELSAFSIGSRSVAPLVEFYFRNEGECSGKRRDKKWRKKKRVWRAKASLTLLAQKFQLHCFRIFSLTPLMFHFKSDEAESHQKSFFPKLNSVGESGKVLRQPIQCSLAFVLMKWLRSLHIFLSLANYAMTSVNSLNLIDANFQTSS